MALAFTTACCCARAAERAGCEALSSGPVYILDTAAFLAGMNLDLSSEIFSTPRVMDEVNKGRPAKRLEILKDAGLQVFQPDNEIVKFVQEKAASSGDRLSDTDMEVLALALEKDGTLVTDDYSLQNVASILGIEFIPVEKPGIKEERTWIFICQGCKRKFQKEMDECPVCGSALRRRVTSRSASSSAGRT